MLGRYTNTPQQEARLEYIQCSFLPGSTGLESVVLAAELLSRAQSMIAGNKKAACSAARCLQMV